MTMLAPSLFDTPLEPPLASRRSDPETSRAAARGVDHKERKREVMSALRYLDSVGRLPAPSSEVQRAMRRLGVVRELGSIRSRLSQLRHDGCTDTTGGVRTTSVDEGGTGRPEQLWKLV